MNVKLAPWVLLGLVAVSSASLYGCDESLEPAANTSDGKAETHSEKIEGTTEKE